VQLRPCPTPSYAASLATCLVRAQNNCCYIAVASCTVSNWEHHSAPTGETAMCYMTRSLEVSVIALVDNSYRPLRSLTANL
jgi:hypothetical protein